jgi:peptidoglycan/xylan/chitin deacetylase (PgdA/CDA1 family)
MSNLTLKRVASKVLDPIGYALLMPRFADLGMAHRHGPRTEKRVALTFDDGPVPGGTEAVQDTLSEFGVVGTFFCVGANALQHPQLILRGEQAGHVIGVHSMHHGRLTAVAPTGTAHIDDCLQVIRTVLGRTPALYRPPWGWLTPWETLRLRSRGLEVIRWDIESPDSLVPVWPADAMLAWTLPKVRPGSIIVCHDGAPHADRQERPETVQLLRRLIPALRDQSYTFATVPELLGLRAYQEDRLSIHDPHATPG